MGVIKQRIKKDLKGLIPFVLCGLATFILAGKYKTNADAILFIGGALSQMLGNAFSE